MRLDRYVSQATGTPRTQTTRWIRGGLVQVGSLVVKDGAAQVVVGRDRVRLRGADLDPPGHLVLMLHKPTGVVTSTETGIGPTVMDCVSAELRRRDLAPIGRLDKDTTGLLLLTTDGGLNHALTHPRRHIEKAYLASLDGELCADAEARFEAGIALADGTPCLPARLERLDPGRARIVLREGKFHQVKRMVAACGAAVVALHRERIGSLWLDPTLPPGCARKLTGDELVALGACLPDAQEAP